MNEMSEHCKALYARRKCSMRTREVAPARPLVSISKRSQHAWHSQMRMREPAPLVCRHNSQASSWILKKLKGNRTRINPRKEFCNKKKMSRGNFNCQKTIKLTDWLKVRLNPSNQTAACVTPVFSTSVANIVYYPNAPQTTTGEALCCHSKKGEIRKFVIFSLTDSTIRSIFLLMFPMSIQSGSGLRHLTKDFHLEGRFTDALMFASP